MTKIIGVKKRENFTGVCTHKSGLFMSFVDGWCYGLSFTEKEAGEIVSQIIASRENKI